MSLLDGADTHWYTGHTSSPSVHKSSAARSRRRFCIATGEGTLASTSLFHPIQPSRISDEAVNQIKKLIDEGVFRPDDKLPSERELVQALSVSRTSVREALRVLEAMGYIEVLPGVGARVVDRRIGGELSSRWTDWMVEH